MRIIVSNAYAEVSDFEQLTSGMVGKTVEAEFSEDWDGLIKVAVFSNGEISKKIINPTEIITIPWEVLSTPNKTVFAGFYGYTVENGEKVLAIPTIYADLGRVRHGADPSATPGNPASPDIAEQLQYELGDHEERLTELERHGGGGGAIFSVNGKAGNVVLTANDIHALPDDTEIPSLDGYAETSYVDGIKNDFNDALSTKQDKGDYALRSELPIDISKWLTDSEHEHYAMKSLRFVSTNWAARGMCRCEYEETECIAQAFINTYANKQKIFIINAADGSVYASAEFEDLGHANSLAWDGTHLYVTASSGSTIHTVVKLSVDLEVVQTFDVSPYNPRAITYAGGKFYTLGRNNHLIVFDTDFNLKDEKEIFIRNDSIYQGMASDGEFLYIPNSYWISQSWEDDSVFGAYIDVFGFNGDFLHTINLDLPYENEEIDFFDDFVLSACGTSSTAVYIKTAIYANEDGKYISHSYRKYTFSGINFNNQNRNYYVDEDYNGFLMDGTNAHPFFNVWLTQFSVPQNVEQISIYLKSDISTTFRINNVNTSGRVVAVYAQNHKLKKGFYVDGITRLSFNDAIISGSGNSASEAGLFVRAVPYAYMNNITITGAYTSTRCAFFIGSNVVINSLTLSAITDYTNAVLDTSEGGELVINSLTSDSNTYVTSWRNPYVRLPSINNSNQLMLLYKGAWGEAHNNYPIYVGVNFDLAKIRKSCFLRVPQSITIANLPSGMTGKPSAIEAKWLTTSALVIRLYVPNGNETYEGYLNTSTETLVWQARS